VNDIKIESSVKMAVNSVNSVNNIYPQEQKSLSSNSETAASSNLLDKEKIAAMQKMSGSTIMSNQVASMIDKNKPPKIDYAEDGKTIGGITEYDAETGKKIKHTIYRNGTQNIATIFEYDKNTGNIIKDTEFEKDGKTIQSTSVSDSETGQIKEVCNYKTGKLVTKEEYENGKPSKTLHYKDDGVTVGDITELQYDTNTGKLLTENTKTSDGKLIESAEYDQTTGKVKKLTEFDIDGKTIKSVLEGNQLTNFKPDGKTIDFITVGDPKTNKPIKKIMYQNNEMKSVIDLDENGAKVKETFYSNNGKDVGPINEYDPKTGKLKSIADTTSMFKK
jgi:hypothetical protein